MDRILKIGPVNSKKGDLDVVDKVTVTPVMLYPVTDHVRAGAGKTPNKRLHGAVYKSLGALFFGIMTVWAITFRHSPIVLFNLAICFIYLAMYLGGPILFARATGEGVSDKQSLYRFLREPFDTNTGLITGKQAWVQICLIPGALFLCTVGMGIAVAIAT